MAGEIQAAFNAVYVDGPSTMPTQPAKPAIRTQIGGTIQAQFDSLARLAAGKWVSFSTLAAMNDNLGYGADTEARVYNDGDNNGVYKKIGAVNSGSWIYVGPIPDNDNTQTIADLVEEVAGNTADIVTNTQAIADVETTVTSNTSNIIIASNTAARRTSGVAYRKRLVAGNPRVDNGASGVVHGPSGSFTRWCQTIVPARQIESPADIKFWLPDLLTGGAKVLELTVTSRPLANADNAPEKSYDSIILTRQYTIADIVEDVTDNNARECVLSLDLVVGSSLTNIGPLVPSKAYTFVLKARDASNNYCQLGIYRGQAAGSIYGSDATKARYHGWAYGAAGWNVNGGTGETVSNSDALAYELREYVAMLPSDQIRNKVHRVTKASETPYPEQYHWPTNSFQLPEVVLERGSWPITVPGGGHTHALPATVTGFSQTINPVYNVSQAFAYQYLSGLVVVRNSDGATLTENVDYVVDYDQGTITGLINTAQFAATATYTGYKSRYDTIYIDASSGAIGTANGAERGGDVAEFLPALPSYKIPLWNVLVTVNRGVDVIPVFQWRDLVRIGGEAEHVAWLEYVRQRIPKTLKKLRTAAAVKFGVYGDSDSSAGSSQDVTAPNGVNRDNINFYQTGRIGSDVLSALTLYDHSDGGGTVHVHTGYCWYLKAAMEARYASTVTFQNWSIGGTQSGAGTLNGSDATRLGNVKAAALDFVLVAFGGNELGSVTTYTNIRNLIQAFKSVGTEVIVMGMPLYPESGHRATRDVWLYTADALSRAALDEDVAYVPTQVFADPDNLGGLGLARRSLCDTSGHAHAGPNEVAHYGRFLAKIVP